MKRTLTAALMVASFLTLPTFGQGMAKDVLAEELLQIMHVRENTEKSFATVRQMLPLQMESIRSATGQPQDSSSATNDVGDMLDMMARELSWDNMKKDYIALYAETFSEDELRGMIEFYKTPVGQAWINKQPEVARKSMELGQRLMMRLMPRMRSLGRDMSTPMPPAHAEKTK